MRTRRNSLADLVRGIVCCTLVFGLAGCRSDRITAGELTLEGEFDGAAGEGPSWDPAGFLYFSGAGRLSRMDGQGNVSTVDAAIEGPNGSMVLPDGAVVVCDSRGRRVSRIESDGTVTPLAESYEGMRFNSPNDLSIDSQGRIYFTDPRYGRRDDMEVLDGDGRPVEGVYRIDAPGEVTRIITHEVDRPNGVLVSSDDRYLYVADNNNNTEGGARVLWRFDLAEDGSVDPASRTKIFDWKTGRGPDGLKMDTERRLFVAAGRNEPTEFETADEFRAGVYVLSPEGELLEFVPVPRDETTNCAFGGEDLRTLYITAGGSLYSIRVSAPGRITAQ